IQPVAGAAKADATDPRERGQEVTTDTPSSDHLPEAAQWQRTAFLAGGAGLIVSLLGLPLAGEVYFFRAMLVAFCLCVGVALGSLVVLMLQYLTGGDWGFILRRPLEAATRTLPLVTLFYLPVALGMPWLYQWANAEEVARNVNLQHKAPYL